MDGDQDFEVDDIQDSDDWFYLEDDYPLADELAESQIPDPGYSGTRAEIDMEGFEYDLYEFWDDVEYGFDTFWDAESPASKAGDKRKRAVGDKAGDSSDKRRRPNPHADDDGGGVRFIRLADRLKIKPPPLLGKPVSYALLPDWKERFAGKDFVPNKNMPAEMKTAAEGKEMDTPQKKPYEDAGGQVGDDEGWEDESDQTEPGSDTAAGVRDEVAALDPETLQAILRQNLGEAGLQGMDEGTIMQALAKMLAGEDDVDNAVGNLASSLLGQVTEGNNAALSSWLSQQGVSLSEGEEDDASSVATVELPEGPAKVGQLLQSSPPDSVIDFQHGRGRGRDTGPAIHDQCPTASGKKRAAPTEGRDGAGKRKKVTFDVPSALQSDTTAASSGNPVNGEEETAMPNASTSDNPPAPDAPIADANGPTKASKTTNGTAVNAKNADVKNSKTKTVTMGAGERGCEDNTISSKNSAPPQQSRKRKTPTDADEEIESAVAPAPKRQTRKAKAAQDAKPPATRTRSARATKAAK